MVKSKSYSPFRYAPWCFRDLLQQRAQGGLEDARRNGRGHRAQHAEGCQAHGHVVVRQQPDLVPSPLSMKA